jgi:hypothetical protein
MRNVTGEQIAQVDNPDPFAPPVWRSPVYRTPEGVIWLVQLLRLLWRVIWFLVTHPLLDVAAGLAVLVWLSLGWPGLTGLGVLVVVALSGLWLLRPDWFARFVTDPLRDKRRRWFYRRHWQSAMTLAGLAPTYRRKVMVPVLGAVRAAGAVDLVTVTLVTGQAPGNFARSRRAAGPGAEVRTVFTHVRELAPVRSPAQERPAGPVPRLLQGQGTPTRAPRLRRAAGPGLPQVVRQDPRGPPWRPQGVAGRDARPFGNQPQPVRLGTCHARRRRPHAQRPTASPRRS